ncbi:MAG: hypothetical protein ROR55_03140 [Devosia sp.]
MWWRKSLIVIAAGLVLAACQVRPLYLDQSSGGPLSPVPDLQAVVVDPPTTRAGQVLRNELVFLMRGRGGEATEQLYRLRVLSNVSSDPLAVELEEDLPAAVLLTMNATFILSEIGTERTLLTGESFATASYDFSSQRFANERAKRNAEDRAAKAVAVNINTRLAAYFAARRSKS